MFCKNCGTKLKKEAKFCHSCGTDSTVMPIDDSKKTEEELSRNKELLLRHLAGDLNPDEMKVVAELLRSNDWARDFLKEAAENARAPRADIPDSTKKILQQQEEIKVKRAKIIGLSLNPKSTVKRISQESKENSEINTDVSKREEVIDTTSPVEQDLYQTSKLTSKEVKPSHVENTDEVKDGEESVEVVSAEPKDPKCICNHCDQHISFDESMVGTEVTCPGCGNGTVLYIPKIEITEKIVDKSKKESKRKRINDAKEKIVTYINKLNPRKAAAYAIAVIVILLVLFYLTRQPNLLDMEVVQEIIDEEAEEDLQIRGENPDRMFYKKNSQIPYSGWAVMYYSNGQIQSLVQVYKGKQHGQTASWYNGGQMSEYGNFKDGIPNGKQAQYYESGQIKTTGYMYKTGPHGKVLSYFENGQLETVKNFSGGKLDGKEIVYYESGEIKSQFNLEDGKEDGKCILFAENGKKTMEYDYSKGKLIIAKAYTSDGDVHMLVENGNGMLQLPIGDEFYPHRVTNGVIEDSRKVMDREIAKTEVKIKDFTDGLNRPTDSIRRTNSRNKPPYPKKWRSFAGSDDKYMEIGKPIRIFKNKGGELKLVAGFGGVDGNVSIPIENKKFKKIAKIGFGKVEHGKEGVDFINGKAYFVCGIWGPIDEGDKISPIDGFLGYYKIRIEPMRQDTNLNMIDWSPTTHKLLDYKTGKEITLLHEPKNRAERKRGLNPKFVDLIADGKLPWE